jgi:hypothetical protein
MPRRLEGRKAPLQLENSQIRSTKQEKQANIITTEQQVISMGKPTEEKVIMAYGEAW